MKLLSKNQKNPTNYFYLTCFSRVHTQLEHHRKVRQHLEFISKIKVQKKQLESPRNTIPFIFFFSEKISSVNKDDAVVRFASRPGVGYDDTYTFQQQTAEILKRYTVQVAKQTHSALQKFFLFIHGINSGYALWICIFAYVFTNADPTNFFNIYRTIALITHLLFYLFLAICMVDILDR